MALIGCSANRQVVAERLGERETLPEVCGVPSPSNEQQASFLAEFAALRAALPARIAEQLTDEAAVDITDITIDAECSPIVHKRDGSSMALSSECVVTQAELVELVHGHWLARGIVVGPDHRATLPNVLHRLSVKIDRHDEVDGVTARVGRHCTGAAGVLLDLISRVAHENASLLLVGMPDKGKTTLLRECAALLASDEYGKKRIHIVVKSCEIAGVTIGLNFSSTFERKLESFCPGQRGILISRSPRSLPSLFPVHVHVSNHLPATPNKVRAMARVRTQLSVPRAARRCRCRQTRRRS